MAEQREFFGQEGEEQNVDCLTNDVDFPLLIPKKPDFISRFVFTPKSRPEQQIFILAPKTLAGLKEEKLRNEAEALAPLWPLDPNVPLISLYSVDVKHNTYEQRYSKVLRGITLELPSFVRMFSTKDLSLKVLKERAQLLCNQFNEAYSGTNSLGNRDPNHFSLRVCFGRKVNEEGKVTLLTFNMTTFSFVQQHKWNDSMVIKPQDLDVWIQLWSDGSYVNKKLKHKKPVNGGESGEEGNFTEKNYPVPVKYGFRVGFFGLCEMIASIKFKQYMESRKKEWNEMGFSLDVLNPVPNEDPVPISLEFLEHTRGQWRNPVTGDTWRGVCA